MKFVFMTRMKKMKNNILKRSHLLLVLIFVCSCAKTQNSSLSNSVIDQPKPPLSFINSNQNLGAGNGGCIAEGDIDGDGDVDILISNKNTKSKLFINDGLGEFALSNLVFEPSTCVAFGDVNGDTSLDIVFTHEMNIEVWLNIGEAKFSKSDQTLTSLESTSIALGDLDDDGDLDAFVTNWNIHPNQVFLNDGTGFFSDSGQKLGNMYGNDVALGDIDNDGDLDALVANNGESSKNSAVLWINEGDGFFSDSEQRLGFTNAYSVSLGDIDSDGDLDAYVANSSHNGADPADQVWINNGKGVFSDSGQRLGNLYSLIVELVDIDIDGDLDAVTGNWKSSLRIWLNDGYGNFLDSKIISDSTGNAGLGIYDIDGDKDLDIVVTTNDWEGSDGLHKVWVNQQFQ